MASAYDIVVDQGSDYSLPFKFKDAEGAVKDLTGCTAREVPLATVRGLKGDAATIAVGSVTTGEPGTAASVTNSGTPGSAILDFVIPRGDKGEQGERGATGYSGADGKAEMNNTYRVHYTYVSRAKSSATGQSNRTGTLTFYYLDYLNASGVANYASGTYGIYGSCSSCSTSTSGTNMKITIASPTWYGRASSTSCKLDNINKLDTTNTKLYWIVDIFSADHFSTPLGWFVGDRMFEAFDAGSIGSLGGQS